MRSLKSELLRHGFCPSEQAERKKKSRTRDKYVERLTDKDWEELMGANRPIYKRGKGGAFRQR